MALVAQVAGGKSQPSDFLQIEKEVERVKISEEELKEKLKNRKKRG